MNSSPQATLFQESLNRALEVAVTALGGAKAVGHKLRPEMLADAAGKWLCNCLNDNPDVRMKLEGEQIMWILREARKVGCHAAINYICGDAGYANPLPVEPEDEKAQLMREFIAATAQQKINIEKLERLGLSPVNLRVAAG
jgi:hypothetical protein